MIPKDEDPSSYNEIRSFLEYNWTVFRDECVAMGKRNFNVWVEEYLHNGLWSILGFYLHGTVINDGSDPRYTENNHALCPRTSALLAEADARFNTISSAGFSLLEAGAETHWHDHPNDTHIYRIHLGLVIPSHDACRFEFDGEIVRWREGETILFDNTIRHRAVNGGNQDRYVLIVDILRRDHQVGAFDGYKNLTRAERASRVLP